MVGLSYNFRFIFSNTRLIFCEFRYGPTKYPYKRTVIISSRDRPEPTLELYPRRLRVYRIIATPPPPTYISVSRNMRMDELLEELNVGIGVTLFRLDFDRPWGDSEPLSTYDFWNTPPKDRKEILSKTPTQAALQQTVADALLESHDSIVVRGTATPGAAAVVEPKKEREELSLTPLFQQDDDYFLKMTKASPAGAVGSSSTLTLGSTQATPPALMKSKYQPPVRTKGTCGLNNLYVLNSYPSKA